MKRIEYRGRYLRASRTGGVALRDQIRVGKINVTANSQHGVRVSRRLWKGTQVALQHGRPVLRGRYQAGPLNLNLSRSGLSASGRVGPGTLNLTHPLRSSATVAGVNVRGRNALLVHTVYGTVQLLAALLMATLRLTVLLGRGLYQLALWTAGSLYGVSQWLAERVTDYQARRQRRAACQHWQEQGLAVPMAATGLCAQPLETLLRRLLDTLARGRYLPETDAVEPCAQRINHRVEQTASEHFPGAVQVIFLSLLDEYREQVSDREQADAFARAVLAVNHPANRLQQQLLETFARRCDIRLNAAEVD